MFAVIFLYVVVRILMFVTEKHVSFYEVHEGAILKDETYTAVAIRSEETVPADKSGYLNFYEAEGTKIPAGRSVCAVSREKLVFQEKGAEAEEQGTLTADEQKTMLSEIRTFADNYNENMFFDVYTLKHKLEEMYADKTNQAQNAKLGEALSQEKEGSYETYYSKRDGLLIYHIDGYEGLREEEVTDAVLNRKDYVQKAYGSNQKVKAGEGAYKLVTGDEWSVVLKLDEKTAKDLLGQEKTSIRVRFLKDNVTMIAGLKIRQEKKDGYYAVLSFDSAMVRYAAERYLDVELVLEDVTGLKVPKTAVEEKDCYMVPLSYIVDSGDDGTQGVLVTEGSGGKKKFQEAEVYYTDAKKEQACISAENLPPGTVIQMKDSNNTKTLSKTEKQPGVYEAGSGYAVFTAIEIAEENEDYYITGSGAGNKLSNYDRIVLNADAVKNNEILFR